MSRQVELHRNGRTFFWDIASRKVYAPAGGIITHTAYNREQAYAAIDAYLRRCG